MPNIWDTWFHDMSSSRLGKPHPCDLVICSLSIGLDTFISCTFPPNMLLAYPKTCIHCNTNFNLVASCNTLEGAFHRKSKLAKHCLISQSCLKNFRASFFDSVTLTLCVLAKPEPNGQYQVASPTLDHGCSSL